MEKHGNFHGNDRVHYGKPWDFGGAPFSVQIKAHMQTTQLR